MEANEVVQNIVDIFPGANVPQLTNAVMLAVNLGGENHHQILQRALEIFLDKAHAQDNGYFPSITADPTLAGALQPTQGQQTGAADDDDSILGKDFELAVQMALEELEHLPPAAAANHKRPGSPGVIDSAEVKKRKTELDKELGIIYNCDSCDNINDKFTNCRIGHTVCKKCVKPVITSAIRSDRLLLKCPVAHCSEIIKPEDLFLMETSSTVELFKQHVRRRQNLISVTVIQNLDGIVTCPRCSAAAEVEDDITVFRCPDPHCGSTMCRYCKSPVAVTYNLNGTPNLRRSNLEHEWCFILRYGSQSSAKDLFTPPAHWEFFSEGEYDSSARRDHTLVPYGPPNRPFEPGFLTSLFSAIVGDPPQPQQLPPVQPLVKGGYVTVLVDRESREFFDIATFYRKTSRFQVKDVYRVQNVACWERYMLKRRHLVKDLGEAWLNERFLYHWAFCAGWNDVIFQKGFEVQNQWNSNANEQNVSFYSHAASCEYYSTENIHNFVILACVMLGRYTNLTGDAGSIPMDGQTGRMFDSRVTSLNNNRSNYFVFSGDQCYPAYLIDIE